MAETVLNTRNKYHFRNANSTSAADNTVVTQLCKESSQYSKGKTDSECNDRNNHRKYSCLSKASRVKELVFREGFWWTSWCSIGDFCLLLDIDLYFAWVTRAALVVTILGVLLYYSVSRSAALLSDCKFDLKSSGGLSISAYCGCSVAVAFSVNCCSQQVIFLSLHFKWGFNINRL